MPGPKHVPQGLCHGPSRGIVFSTASPRRSGEERKNAQHGDITLRSRTAWAGYAACALALLHAAVSFYWASGSTAGLSTVGGKLEEMDRPGSPALAALVWGVGALKVLAGLLALALVMPREGVLPR